MRILVSGTHGLIGSALVRALVDGGDQVVRLVRGAPGADDEVALGALPADLDAVVHLAGAPIARRWTAARQRAIRDSRVDGTRRLVEALERTANPPETLVCASGANVYAGGFLGSVCRDWEAAANAFAGRVVTLRLGMVLAAGGGALRAMRRVFRWGLGGPVGSGRQRWCWIALDDAVAAVRHVLDDDRIAGPVDLVSANPVTNAEFTRALARVLHRPAFFRVPAWAAKLALGQMAREVLLADIAPEPTTLLETGFVFRYPTLGPALRAVLS